MTRRLFRSVQRFDGLVLHSACRPPAAWLSDLGGRGRRRPGSPASPVAGRGGRAGAGYAAQSRRLGAAASHRETVLCELIPGGISKEITAAHAARVLESVKPSGAVDATRCDLAPIFLDDLGRIDSQMSETKKRLTAAVRASATTTTETVAPKPISKSTRTTS
jgi:hypothetical protein